MKKTMGRLLRVIVLLAVVAGISAYLWKTSQEARREHYSGYAEGEYVYVSSPISGQLQTLAVQRGDQTRAGQALFELERAEEKAARAEAEEMMNESAARLKQATLDYQRAKNLRAKNVIASEDYDTAEQTFLAAQHTAAARERSLEQADWRYTQKSQAAPAEGLVYDTYYRPGEWVAAGTPVLSILPPEYVKVRFFVPEADLGKLQVGAPLRISLDGLPESLPGRVTFVSPSAEYTLPIIYSRENRNKLVFLVEGSLAPEDARKLHPGAPIEVRLAENEKQP